MHIIAYAYGYAIWYGSASDTKPKTKFILL